MKAVKEKDKIEKKKESNKNTMLVVGIQYIN